MTQYQRFELSRLDEEIAELEKKIKVKHEQRRELVNRMGLNKGGEVGAGNSYVLGEAGTDALMPNKCEHLFRSVEAFRDPRCGYGVTTEVHKCLECGEETERNSLGFGGLPLQHEELKP